MSYYHYSGNKSRYSFLSVMPENSYSVFAGLLDFAYTATSNNSVFYSGALMRSSFIISYLLLAGFLFEGIRSASAQIIITPAKSQPKVNTKQKKDKKPTQKKKNDYDIWSVIYVGKKQIGYTHNKYLLSTLQGKQVILMTENNRMTFQRFGQSLTIKTESSSVATQEGDLKSFYLKIRSSPTSVTTSSGSIQEGQLHRNTKVAGKTQTTRTPWRQSIKMPSYELYLLKKNRLQPKQTFRFESYQPELSKIVKMTITVEKYEEVLLLDGKKQRLLRVKIVNSLRPQMPTTVWVDKQGDALRAQSDFIGNQKMITFKVKPEVALKEIAGEELDLAVNSLIRVNLIKKGHQSKKVIYKIKTPQNDPATLIATGATQFIKKIDDETLELTVTKIDLSQKGKFKKPDESYTKPSLFIQSRDAKVRAHVLRASGNRLDRLEVALLMEKYVHQKIQAKNFSTALASAAEVAKNMEGDCTEHAVLLAAMLRAKKIPSRVAVGLVYIERQSVFGGHMWTEAYVNGHWIPLDATLGRGGIGAAHIKLTDSSFSDDAPAPVTLFLPMMSFLNKTQITVVTSE